MPLSLDAHLGLVRAIGEQTRLRITALLQHGELSVSDLTEILGQSQPRISRHLKLLVDAGAVDRHREGAFVFFSLVRTGDAEALITELLATLDPADPVVLSDANRLADVRSRRAAASHEYFERIADDWDQVRSLQAPDDIVEDGIHRSVSDRQYRSVLDLGTGTGRMLQLLAGPDAPSAPERVAGLDNNPSMLAVARGNLDRSSIHGVELRQGDIHHPPFEAGAFELVVIHQVLHFLDDPDRAVEAAARLVAPGGRLLIVDFAPHDLEFLQSEHAHRRLGFRADTIASWLGSAGLITTAIDHIGSDDDRLTVSMWLAERSAAEAGAATGSHSITPTLETAP